MDKKAVYIKMVLLIAALLSSVIINGQGTGLVLSGGGAKGLAHIGVIKALEENNIKIDYIAGTSMGAIVGALYVMGYTTEEMRDLVTSEEFIGWSTGSIEPQYRFSYKRTEADPSMFTIGLKRDEEGTKTKFPTHVVPSQVIDFAMLELTCGADAASGNNFDSLMIPFRCVAADVYNKRAFVMGKGNLGRAVKASMAYPLYFEPVIIDSILLFDGGIYNNFPFEVLIEDFKPGFIIGSKVVSRSKQPGIDDVILQLQNMIMQETNFEIPDSVGFVIETKLENVNLLDFNLADSLISQGYRSAMKVIESIITRTEYIDSVGMAERRACFRAKMPEKRFGSIQIDGVSERQKDYIVNLISKQEKTFDIEQLKTEYFRLVSEENISHALPVASYNPLSGAFDLLLDVKLKGAYSLSAGGLISLSTYNQFYLGFNYYSLSEIFNMFSANVYLGQYYSSFRLAHRIIVPQKNKLLIDFGLTGNRWNYFTNEAPTLFKNLSPSFVVRNERTFRADVGTPTGNNSLFSTGLGFAWIEDDYYQNFRYTDAEVTDNSEYFYASAIMGYETNTLNNRQFSTRGNYLLARANYNAGFEFFNEGVVDSLVTNEEKSLPSGWFSFRLKSENYSHLGSGFVLGTMLDITLSNRQVGYNYTSTVINAYKFEPTPFSRQLFGRSYRANSFVGAGIIPVYNFTRDMSLRSGIYLFAPLRSIIKEADGVAYGDYFADLKLTAELALVYDSPAGPVSFGLNYYSHEEKKLFYFLNFGYILFNRRGLE